MTGIDHWAIYGAGGPYFIYPETTNKGHLSMMIHPSSEMIDRFALLFCLLWLRETEFTSSSDPRHLVCSLSFLLILPSA